MKIYFCSIIVLVCITKQTPKLVQAKTKSNFHKVQSLEFKTISYQIIRQLEESQLISYNFTNNTINKIKNQSNVTDTIKKNNVNKSASLGLIIGISIGSSLLIFILIALAYLLLMCNKQSEINEVAMKQSKKMKKNNNQKELSKKNELNNLSLSSHCENKNNKKVVQNKNKKLEFSVKIKENPQLSSTLSAFGAELSNSVQTVMEKSSENDKSNNNQESSKFETKKTFQSPSRLKSIMKNKYDVASKSFSTTLGESHSGLTVLNNKNSTLDTSPFRHTDSRETPAEKVLSIEQRYEKDSYLNCYSISDQLKVDKLESNGVFILKFKDENENAEEPNLNDNHI